MKKKFKVFIAVIFTLVIFCNASVFAASVNISANTSVEIGNNVTISISVPGVTGKCTVTSSNSNVIALSTGSVWVERGATGPIVGYTKGVGTATITVTPDTMADDNTGDDVSVVAKSITINVKEKYVPPVVNENTNNNASNNSNTNNNTNANTNTNVSQNNNVTNTSNKGSNTTTKDTKSSNALLSKLQVNVEGLTPDFNKNKFSYTLALNEKVDSLNVTAVAEDSKAKVAISGNTDLKEGDNTISIVVTAENGTKKTYTIIATKSADPMKSDSYLANLIIEDCELSPAFSSEIFEYDLGKVSLEKLNIYAYPKNESAKVEIIGNETLVDGENIVKIKITSVDGTTTKEYTLKVIKDASLLEETVEVNALVDEGKMQEVSKFQKIKSLLIQNWLVIVLFILVIIEFIEITYLYFKYHKLNGTLPWKKCKVEKEKNSWFKKLNNNNDDFNSDEFTKSKEESEKIKEDCEEKNTDIISSETNNEVNNQVDEEIKDEIPNELQNEIEEEISYEAIMSQINDLGSEINNEINDDFETKIDNEEETENKEKRTRNGRI